MTTFTGELALNEKVDLMEILWLTIRPADLFPLQG